MMFRSSTMRATLFMGALLALASLLRPTESFSLKQVAISSAGSSSALYYVDDEHPAATTTEVAPKETSIITTTTTTTTAPNTTNNKKATIYPIHTLQELYDFLQEDDDRLTAIKFYAPWCKYCQKVGLHYKKLAVELGDGVVARQLVEGSIRCAAIEYSSLTAQLMTEQLQVTRIPTLQLYKGTTKLWQSPKPTSGNQSHDDAALGYPANKITRNNVKAGDLKREVKRLLAMSKDELNAYVTDFEDDGILEEAMEDAFFDNM